MRHSFQKKYNKKARFDVIRGLELIGCRATMKCPRQVGDKQSGGKSPAPKLHLQSYLGIREK